MTDKELDVYLVLILFMLNKKKFLPSKKSKKILVKENIQIKREQRTDFTTI